MLPIAMVSVKRWTQARASPRPRGVPAPQAKDEPTLI
jgi:hypothetical protein